MYDFGELLKKLRTDSGLPQSQLARKINKSRSILWTALILIGTACTEIPFERNTALPICFHITQAYRFVAYGAL